MMLVVSEEYTLANIYGKNFVFGYIIYCLRYHTLKKMKKKLFAIY